MKIITAKILKAIFLKSDMTEYLVLVDEEDNEVGTEEKLEAHKKAKLHRAISAIVYNSKGEMLLQQREKSKYHCGGLWSNTSCTHPRQGETPKQAAERRLKEEMGMSVELKETFSFRYKVEFSNGLTENEFNHVFIGFSDEKPKINKSEVENFKYLSMKKLREDIKKNPEKYTPWFRLIVEKLENVQSRK